MSDSADGRAGPATRSDAALRLLAHKAKLNGYALDPEQSSSVFGFSIDIHLGRENE